MNVIFQLLYFFIVYAFLGWVVEVAYHAVGQGVIVNRGFLNGPVCPIYGFGMLLVLEMLLPISDHLLVLFLGGMLLTTAIELLGGWMLEKLFHMRWWDYSKEPFNLKGYICPKFSLAWGLGVVFAVRVIHTIVCDLGKIVLGTRLRIIMLPLAVLLIVDLAATVATIMKLQKELRHLDHLAHEMREFSDALTDVIGNRAMNMEQKIDETRVQAALGKAEGKDYLNRRRQELEKEIQERRRKVNQTLKRIQSNKLFGLGRILAAYPQMILVRTEQNLKDFVDQMSKK